jgi:hypothetical protein
MRFKPDLILEQWRGSPFEDRWTTVFNPFVCNFGQSQGSTTQTTTQNTAPWSGQQPYLTSGFSAASNLLGQSPPTQSNPVVPMNGTQNTALSGIANIAQNGTPITGAATNFATNLENGGYLANNPSYGYFSGLAGSNLGLNNPGSAILQSYASGSGSAPGTAALQKFANGGYFSGNNYSDATAQSVLSQVVPSIEAQFNHGNSLNNPAAAFATAQGATAALAPIEYQNYQQQEQLQQQAANNLAANSLTGANSLQSGALAGGNLQATAAAGLGSNYNAGVTSMVQGNALAPQNQALSYGDLDKLFNTGSMQQTQAQNEASGAAATSNYAQLSPYQQLAAYMQAVGGNYGQSGSGSTTTPYFQNKTADTLGTVAGVGSLLATAAPFLSFL